METSQPQPATYEVGKVLLTREAQADLIKRLLEQTTLAKILEDTVLREFYMSTGGPERWGAPENPEVFL